MEKWHSAQDRDTRETVTGAESPFRPHLFFSAHLVTINGVCLGLIKVALQGLGLQDGEGRVYAGDLIGQAADEIASNSRRLSLASS